ncbi:MAG: hypothetical protein R6V54_02700 [Desulfobacteraceae bacterium]
MSWNIKAMFKRCNNCGTEWKTRKAFLNDKDLVITGYQAHFEELTLGLFLFNHNCKTTLAIAAGEFQDLYRGPVFAERLTDSDQCPGYCLDQDELEPCPNHCECAYIREIIQLIKNRTWTTERCST